MANNGKENSTVIPPELGPYKRKAWKPVTIAGDGSLTSSKFAGTPLLAQNEQWPRCANCNKPMQLFLQLNMADIPEEARKEFGEGILQFFYCTSQVPPCEIEFPFSRSTLLRMLPANQQVSDTMPQTGDLVDPFPPRLITDWQILEDFPNWEEGGDLGIVLEDSEWDRLSDDIALPGDKLAGWPDWVQGIEYPSCPVCGQTMSLLFQIDSEDNLPFMFGDSGCGHITQCKDHKDQLAFGWACA